MNLNLVLTKLIFYDTVIAKFSSFEKNKKKDKKDIQLALEIGANSQANLLSQELDTIKYFVVTLWDVKNILKIYESSERPSVDFYHALVASGRLEIIGGERLYEIFLEAYKKEYAIPQEVNFESTLTHHKNVYMGIISAADLMNIYGKCGNGIFFENVRDFIGVGNNDSALDINNEIFRTAREEPEKMLERNNGITFKANSITQDDGSIKLSDAGIINGCQTTLCIYRAKPSDECYVPVKIVITADDENSSNIAKTANTQNKIEKINLELSEFVRPQLIKMSLAEIGLNLDSSEDSGVTSAPLIVSSIYKGRIFQSSLQLLFIGLFSNQPRNILISDYASIKFDDARKVYSDLESKKHLIAMLARFLVIASEVFEDLKKKYPSESNAQDPEGKVGKVFNRFYVDDKGYKPYLIVLAICCMLAIDDEKKFKALEIKMLAGQVTEIIEQREEELKLSLEKIFKAVAINVINRFSGKDKDIDDEISQNLSKYFRSTSYSSFYLTYGML